MAQVQREDIRIEGGALVISPRESTFDPIEALLQVGLKHYREQEGRSPSDVCIEVPRVLCGQRVRYIRPDGPEGIGELMTELVAQVLNANQQLGGGIPDKLTPFTLTFERVTELALALNREPEAARSR